MGIKVYSGWDILPSWTQNGSVITFAYLPPQTAVAAEKQNVGILLLGLKTTGTFAAPTMTCTYGNVQGQCLLHSQSPNGNTSYDYQWMVWIPLAGYNGISNLLTITSSNAVLTQSLIAADGGAFALTLTDVIPDSNPAPLSTAQFINQPPDSAIPAAPQSLTFNTNKGDWIIHAGFLSQTNNTLVKLLPTTGTNSTSQPAASHPNGVGQASYYRASNIATGVSWAKGQSDPTFGQGFRICAMALKLFDPTPPSFNCDCDIVSTWKTLAQVRTQMLVRLGYPNQLVNPPPGMATLIDQHLRDAQQQIYRTIQQAGKTTERFFRWTMDPGQRYYNFTDEELACNVLDPLKISWVGFEDLNEAWYRLDEGIPPEYYTRANINFGWPTRYEIRSCLEIFPAPQAAYTLWVKGYGGLSPLVADSDQFTLDDQACYLLALGNMKTDRGAKDAQLVLKQASDYVMGIVAGTHGTARYVPRSETATPLTPPKFLPLGDAPA